MFVLSDFTTSVHRALKEIDPDYLDYPGVVVCGSHTPHDIEQLIQYIAMARVSGTPFLGICFGHQLAAIEWARHVLNIPDATSEEFSDTGTFVVKKRDGLKVGWQEGENWWSNYEVDLEWTPPENYFVTPSHPEYASYKGHPHELLVNFLKYAKMAA